MKISVVICSFNRRQALLRTLGTVLAQRFKDFEVIVVDDGSTDGTGEALEPLRADGSIRYFHQHNAGVSASRNRGAELARGDWIAFLDSDIDCTEDWLEQVVAYCEADNECGIVATWPILGQFKALEPLMRSVGPPGGKHFREVSRVGGGVATIRRTLFLEMGGLNSDFRFGWEDTDLCWRVFLSGFRVVYLYMPLTFHMKDPSCESRLPRPSWVYETGKNKLYMLLSLSDAPSLPLFLGKEAISATWLALRHPPLITALWNAWVWNAKNIRGALRRRAEWRERRRRPFAELVRLMREERQIDRVNREYLDWLSGVLLSPERE